VVTALLTIIVFALIGIGALLMTKTDDSSNTDATALLHQARNRILTAQAKAEIRGASARARRELARDLYRHDLFGGDK